MINSDLEIIKELPAALRDVVEPLLKRGLGNDARDQLNPLRRVLEQLVAHLCVGKGISEESFSRRLDRLASSEVIPRDVHAYMHAWWTFGSLGSHFQSGSEEADWRRASEFCQLAAVATFDWFFKKYPAVKVTESQAHESRQLIAQMTGSAPDAIAWPENLRFSSKIEKSGALMLHGDPWLGKTTVGVKMALEALNSGFVPIVFHERTLVTPSSLMGMPPSMPRSLYGAAPILNELVPARLFGGTSFFIFLDDPFGHRRFSPLGVLGRIHLHSWIALARRPDCLGKIFIVATSPSSLLHAAESSQDIAQDPIASKNLSLFFGTNAFALNMQSYGIEQVTSVVSNTAHRIGCAWHMRQDICELVSSEMRAHHANYAALRDFCVETRLCSNDEQLLLDTLRHFSSRQDIDKIFADISPLVAKYLLLVVIAEALLSIYRENPYAPKHSFEQITKAAKIEAPRQTELTSNADLELLSWIGEEDVVSLGVRGFPSFRHPEVSARAVDWIRSYHPYAVGELVELLGCQRGEDEPLLSRWELTHLACHCAAFLNGSAAHRVEAEIFSCKGSRFDASTVMDAILPRWDQLSGTALEAIAFAALKRITNEAKASIRPLISMIFNHWREASEEIKFIPMLLNSKSDVSGLKKPDPSPENVLCFLAGVTCNYTVVVDSARRGSPASQECLEYFEAFVTTLMRMHDKPVWPSRVGDGLFNDASLRPLGRRILEELVRLGTRRGEWSEQTALVLQIREALALAR